MSRLRTVLFWAIAITSVTASAQVRWELAYGQDGRYYMPNAVAGKGDGSLIIAGTATDPGLGGARPEFWLWHIDPQGKLLSKAAIATGTPQERINPSVEHISDIVLTRNGGALIVEFVLGDPYFARFDDELRLTVLKRLEIPHRTRININRTLAGPQGDILAFGSADGKAFALRLDANGTVRSSRIHDAAGFFNDAATQPDGSIAAVAYSQANPAEFSVVHFGADGEIRRVDSIKGRRASISQGTNGYVIIYDRATGDDHDIRIATLRDGVLTGDVAIPPFLVAPYRIARLASGRHLVGATTDDDSIAVMTYEHGRVLALYKSDSDHAPQHWSLERVSGSPAAALTTVYATGTPLTTKVGVVWFDSEWAR